MDKSSTSASEGTVGTPPGPVFLRVVWSGKAHGGLRA